MNPDLIRTVQMGPWTHKVDDGLEARKTAYETLYTLVCDETVIVEANSLMFPCSMI